MTAWTEEDKFNLKIWYEVDLLPVGVIAKKLGRTKSQINGMVAQETRNGNMHRLGSRLRWAKRAKNWGNIVLFNSMPPQKIETYLEDGITVTKLPTGYARGIWPQKNIVQKDGGL